MTVHTIDQRRMLAGIGEYDTIRAGMLLNSRSDGSFMSC